MDTVYTLMMNISIETVDLINSDHEGQNNSVIIVCDQAVYLILTGNHRVMTLRDIRLELLGINLVVLV